MKVLNWQKIGSRKIVTFKPQLQNILKNQTTIENEHMEISGKINLEDFKKNWIKILRKLYRQKSELLIKENNEFKLKINTLLLFIYSLNR